MKLYKGQKLYYVNIRKVKVVEITIVSSDDTKTAYTLGKDDIEDTTDKVLKVYSHSLEAAKLTATYSIDRVHKKNDGTINSLECANKKLEILEQNIRNL